MADEEPWSEDRDVRQALAEVDDASSAMANSTETPWGFMFALVAVMATVMTLIGTVPWPVILGLGALFLPLGLWYFLVMRRRPKPRPMLNHSGSYAGYFLLLILAMQFIRFWDVGSWSEASFKWLLVFGISWFCISRMRTASMRDRLKDAHERPV